VSADVAEAVDRRVTAGLRVLRLEAASIAAAADRLGGEFGRAVEMLAGARGRVIVTGVGKSGLIARKIAATLTSTGTPASFLHPTDGLHGDLGIVGRDDVAVVLSKSGGSDELVALVAALQRLGVPIVAIAGRRDSIVGRAATVVLDASVAEEACPHDLAPTASTTVALAVGDALAVALLEEKGFQREDFASLHPGGALGRRLLLRVADVMLPPGRLLPSAAPVRDAVVELAHHRGIALVGDEGTLAGVFTAGDLTRTAERERDFLAVPLSAVMTRAFKTAAPDDFGSAAVGVMERHGIMVLPVLDGGRVAGVVHLHDLMRAGAV
jgi:arabinose-5-phosphate isomerase